MAQELHSGTAGPFRAIGYVRVSTQEQGVSGLGLDAQRRALADACAQRGWTLTDVETDIASGKSTNGRPGLARALERVEGGEADALCVTKLDRLARSVIDGAGIMQRAETRRWALVVLELGLDTSTPMGRFGAHIWLAAAEMERAMIGQRTREALAEAKRRGVALGRKPGTFEIPAAVRETIVSLRAEGLSYRALGDRLADMGISPPRSKRWTPETVRQVVKTHAAG